MSDNTGISENGKGRVVRVIKIPSLYLTVFAVAAGLIWFELFFYAWKIFWNMSIPKDFIKQTYLQIILFVIVSVPIHELIHALGFRFLGNIPWSKIRFGFAVKLLAPYAHPTVPINKIAYAWSGALPGLFLGVIPLITGLIIRSMLLSFLGMIGMGMAGGDVLILWKLRHAPKDAYIQENQEQDGFTIIEKT
jgi:hypothetical protein